MWRDELLQRFPALAALPPGCYVVGGAIRDLLLGRDPSDVDVAFVDALAAARAIGGRVVRLGREHLSAWRVIASGHVYDVAELLDGEIGADLRRRDFTVNAMAVALDDGVFLDPHGGRQDLEARIVRMVEASNFDDDPLRTLKGVRMAVRFDMQLDAATLDAIRERSPRIADIAPERVTYELTAILGSGCFRRAVALLRETELDVQLFGRALHADAFHADDVPLAAAMALLVSDLPAFASRWRWSQQLAREAATLQRLAASHQDLRMALYDAGEAIAVQLPAMLRALGREDDLPMPDFRVRALLTGEEIATLTSLASGPALGKAKRALLEAQVRGEITTRQQAEAWIRERAGHDS